MVFETDKTIAGIPYRSTLFKATKLEEAIREAVREHTIHEGEGNDGTDGGFDDIRPMSAISRTSAANPRRHASNASVVSFSARSPAAQNTRPYFSTRAGGNGNARLYDERDNRTKTAVTAMYRGSQKGAQPALLRSYDSRREPAPEFDCKIWEAGRATCAIGLAFKPIQIGQSVFHDDGAGTFNPAVTALDEAVVNEWPGREVGVFISLGTGKRPKGSDANSSMWYEGFLGEFAEARRKLIAKIEGCEKIHEYVKREHLVKRGVNIENYYRLNVEVGVGEFGMNEWHRLADISTNTRRYLSRDEEQKMVQNASAKLAKIHFAKIRWERASQSAAEGRTQAPVPALVQTTTSDITMPLAVELPGDVPTFTPQRNRTPPSRQSYESGSDALPIPSHGSHTPSPRSSGERLPLKQGSPQPPPYRQQQAPPAPTSAPPPPPPGRTNSKAFMIVTDEQRQRRGTGLSASEKEVHVYGDEDSDDRLLFTAPTPAQYRTASGADKIAIVGADDQPRRYDDRQRQIQAGMQVAPLFSSSGRTNEPPPLPPKTPLNGVDHRERAPSGGRGSGAALPYPVDLEDDEAPPMANYERKPNYKPSYPVGGR